MKSIVKIFAACSFTMLIALNANAYTKVSGIDGPTWYEAKASSFGGGSGSQSAPYVINTPEQLALLTYNVNVNNMSYEGNHFLFDLSNANIDLGKQKVVDGQEQTLNWVPIGETFKGTVKFKGEHFIKGMTIRAVGNLGSGPYHFGLFEILNQSISGARFSDVDFQISRDFAAGSLCGMIDSNSTITIENCTATNVRIMQPSDGNGITGGLVGLAAGCVFRHCTVTGILGGHMCGGMVGKYNGVNYNLDESTVFVEDCHASTEITVDSYSGVRAGGLIGECFADNKAVFAYCSASGSITAPADANRPFMGGLFGYLASANIEHCSSAVSISGTGSVGGLTGFVLSPVTFTDCFASGGIELKNGQDTNVGGLIGLLKNSNNTQCSAYITQCTFAGTFKYDKTQLGSMNYGSIVGNCSTASSDNAIGFFNESQAFNDVFVDKNMCGLPACSSGTLNGVETKLTRELASQEVEGEHVGYEYCYIMPRDMMKNYALDHSGQQVAFKDNFIVASIPFYINEGKKSTSFSAYYITTPFTLAPLVSNQPGVGELARFTLPNDASFLEFDKEDDPFHVRSLDPGHTELTVTHIASGLTRTIHIDVAYGVEWNDDEPSEIFAGDGTQNTPYLIQNVSQLAKAAADPTKNREGAYFRLVNDIFMNQHLIQSDESVKSGARKWTPVEWHANLDGNGKTIYGMYVTSSKSATISKTGPGSNNETFTYYSTVTGAGLFNLLSGNVHDLAIVDSYISATNFIGILCAVMTGEATIRRCMVHGAVDGNTNNGGLVGGSREINFEVSWSKSRGAYDPVYNHCGTIEDCYACVHVEYGIGTGVHKPQKAGSGGGITGSPVGHILRCVSTGKVENFTSRRGVGILSDNSETEIEAQTWYFDRQQMTTDFQSTNNRGEHNTSELINGDIFTDQAAWQHEKGRYPMLRQFADTPYGDILSMPVHFAEGDRAGSVTKIFEFPTENVTWTASNGDTFVDLILDCGAATPMSSGTEFISAQTITAKSQSTKALRVMQIDTKPEGTVGIEFKDPKCESAWLKVFGKSDGEVVTLRHAYKTKATPQGRQFNNYAKELGVEQFPEMRYFTGIKTLGNGILSNLDQLSEVELPKQLSTIDPGAFDGCSSLKTVEIPSTTGNIAEGAFDGNSLTEIQVSPRNEAFSIRDNALFTAGTNDLVAYPAGRGESEITISGPIGVIYDHAFYRIPVLNDIYFDNPKPTGTAPVLSKDESIVHWDCDNGTMMDIHVNDGTYDNTYDESNGGMFDGVIMKEYLSQPLWRTYQEEGKLHRYFPLQVTNAKWATMYIGFATKLPNGLKAYRVNKTSDYQFDETTTEVELKRMNNLLPLTTPVIIKAENAGIYRLEPYVGTVPDVNKYENWLQGTSIGANGRGGYSYGLDVYQSDSNQGSILTLGFNSQGTLGFYYYSNPNGYIPPFRCYLTYNGEMDKNAKIAIYINDEMDEDHQATGISNIKTSNDKSVYDLQGRKVAFDPNQPSSLPKGIYIVNGQKVVIDN